MKIQADNLVFKYGDLLAVDDVSFTVKPGEVLGFLGPNGAGKSTTIKMLTGQIKPYSGHLQVLGSEPYRIKQHIGVCFERTNLYEHMTARENLNFFAKLFSIKKFRAEHLLTRVGLGDRMDDKVRKFSKGLKQRLMIARALVNSPSVLFLDEPTDGLDPLSSEAVRKIILEEKERGASIFLTTHNMFEAETLSDNVVFINDGKILLYDTPLNLKLQYGSKMMLVDVEKKNGETEQLEIPLDNRDTGLQLKEIFDSSNVLRIHSREASLNDIFIKVSGRGLE